MVRLVLNLVCEVTSRVALGCRRGVFDGLLSLHHVCHPVGSLHVARHRHNCVVLHMVHRSGRAFSQSLILIGFQFDRKL